MKKTKESKESKKVETIVEDINVLYPENLRLNSILVCKANVYLKGKGFKIGDTVSLEDLKDALKNLPLAKYEPKLKEYRPILLKRIETMEENRMIVRIR